MTTYRLMDGASGRPGVGSSGTTPPGLTSYTSTPFQAATLFTVLAGGMWLEGFWWWVPAGGDVAAQKFCCWSRYSTSAEIVVPGTTVTSGTLTAGAMNYIALSTPVQLSIGTLYVAATGWQPAAGFPDSNNQFGSGDPYVNGITNGPLTAWGDTSNGSSYGTGYTYNMSQGVFGTGSAGTNGDPTLNFPQSSSSSSNFWVDVQVSDTAPSGYAGSYRIWPAKWDSQDNSGTDTAANYILGTEFSLSESCTVDNIWFYSPPGATQLPTECAIWVVSSQTMVPGSLKTAPGWSGAAGSGWVSASYSGLTLASGDYKTSVWNSAATPSGFNSYTIGYFVAGGFGASGISSGPISVPDAASATSPGQSTYATSGTTYLYPATYVATEGQAYWVDIEVTPALLPAMGVISISGAGVLSDSSGLYGPLSVQDAPLSIPGQASVAPVAVLGSSASIAGSGTWLAHAVQSAPASISGFASLALGGAANVVTLAVNGLSSISSTATQIAISAASGTASLTASAVQSAGTALNGIATWIGTTAGTVTGTITLAAAAAWQPAATQLAQTAVSAGSAVSVNAAQLAQTAMGAASALSGSARLSAGLALAGAGNLAASTVQIARAVFNGIAGWIGTAASVVLGQPQFNEIALGGTAVQSGSYGGSATANTASYGGTVTVTVVSI